MAENPTPEVDIEQFAAARDGGAVVVDVREPVEYAAGHVPGAHLIPMGQLAHRMGEIDRDTQVLVICATGNRSKSMTDLLRGAGYDAYSVAGGTAGWARSGRPVQEGLQ